MKFAAGEIPKQPAVDCPKCQLAVFRSLSSSCNIVQNPSQLRRTKIGVDDQSGLLLHAIRMASVPKSITIRCRPAVLPDDCVVNRLTSRSIPDQSGLTLIGDADGFNVRHVHVVLLQNIARDRQLSRPNFGRVVFHPTWFWIVLCEFLLRHADD